MTNNELSVCKAQNDCIWSLYGLIKNFVSAVPSGLTRVMAVSIPTGWGKTRIAIQSVLRATKSKKATVILYPQRNGHINEIWKRPTDWKQSLDSQFFFLSNWTPLDEKDGAKEFSFKRKNGDDWIDDDSVASRPTISVHLKKKFYCVVNRKKKKQSHKINRTKHLKSGKSPIFFIIDEWHAHDFLKKYEDFCDEKGIELGESVDVFWRKELLGEPLGIESMRNLFILLLSATPIAATNRMDRLYEFASDSIIDKENQKDFRAFEALTGIGNQNREGENQYKIYGIYPKVLKLKMDILETEKKAVRENECIVKLQNKKLLGLWRKDFIELSQEVLKKKKVKSAKKEASDNFGNIIYQQEQSAIISGKHLKIQNLFSLLKKFKERKFLIFCVYRDKVANKLFELIESKYGSGSVDYLNKGDRKKILDAFNDPQSDLRYLIATDKDSQGIDLQQSEAWIIHYELPWNPIRVIQRFGRVWRLNKPNAENADDELTRPVAFYIPSTYSAEEEKINRLQRRWKTLEKVLPKLSSKCLPPIRFDLALGIRVTPSPYKECTCCGKDGKRKMLYSTESEALIAAKRRSKKKIPLRVYQCLDECGYHLTSNQE